MKDIEARYKEIVHEIKSYGFGMLNDMLDPEFIDCNPDNNSCRVRYKKYSWEDNGRGEVHGGVVSAMLDTSMGLAAIANSDGSVSTSDMTVSFIRPFRGKSFIVEAAAVHMGRRVIRCEAKAYDEETGKVLAASTGNFMYVEYEDHPGQLGV